VRAGRTIEEPIGYQAFARTASDLLEIEPPAAAGPGVTLVERR
jgi:hypothetical protein